MKKTINNYGKLILPFIILLLMLIFLNLTLGTIIGILVFFVVMYICNRFDISHKKFLIILISISLLVRVGAVFLVRNTQSYDYETTCNISRDLLDSNVQEDNQNYMNQNNSKIMFILYQTFLLLICNKFLFLKLINVFLNILVLLIIYRISNRISNKKCAQFITIAYSIFINPILYNNVLSNQHVFLFLILIGFDLIFEKKLIKNNYIRIFLVGIIFALASLIGGEAILCVITCICFIVYMLITKKESIKKAVIYLLIIIIGYSIFYQTPLFILRKTGFIENKSKTTYLYKFVSGLDVESNGSGSEDIDSIYNNYTEDRSKLQKYEINKILEGLLNANVFELFKNKIDVFWNQFDNSLTIGHLNNNTLFEFIEKYDRVIWILVLIMAFIGLLKNDNEESKIYSILLIVTFITYMLIDVQITSGFPYRIFVFILATIGLEKIIKYFKEKNIVNESKILQIESKIKEIYKKVSKNKILHILILFILSRYLTLVAFEFSTGSFGQVMYESYLNNPWIFFLNFLPIFWIALICYSIFRRVSISFLISAAISYVVVLINYFKMMFRDDNFLMEDIFLIREASKMGESYKISLNNTMITYIAGFLMITLVLYFLIDKNREKIKKSKIQKIKNIITRILVCFLLILFAVFNFKNLYCSTKYYEKTRNEDSNFNKLSSINQYISRGTIYSFLRSAINLSVEIPEGYEKEYAEIELHKYEYNNIPKDKKVNVIGIMLEAYNDLSKFDEIDFQVDPYKELHEIEKESYSGELVTNIFGGGTINTERKVITGYTNLSNFSRKTNSYAWYFREQGYSIIRSHPYYNWFYNRFNVNINLGFEGYYYFENKYESMAVDEVVYDSVLMPEIFNLYKEHFESRDNPYFSFNVTYQNHGPYPETRPENSVNYVKRKENYTDAEYNILNNYLEGVAKTNKQLKILVDKLKNEDAPVVLIFFGDHNPWLGNDSSVYKMLGINLSLENEQGCNNYYCTPYVIWANDKAKEVLQNDFVGEGEKISPNFLMNKFFELAGYEGNEFMKLTNELKEKVNVINSDFYYENGQYTKELSEDAKKLLDKFYKIQYALLCDT